MAVNNALYFITSDEAFKPTALEMKNVTQYLENGGFIVFDNTTPTHSVRPAEKFFKQMVRDALGSYARFKSISTNHSLYHSFFDFDNGPTPLYITGFEETSIP